METQEEARQKEARWQRVRPGLDTEYSYRLARRMETYKTNEALGYRTAGSLAERRTGEMLAKEMESIGLTVSRDKMTLDGWDFHHARLSYRTGEGQKRTLELGGYQTELDTKGPKEYDLIFVGSATEKELQGLDLQGKLALVYINQRDDWWINYPSYAAHLKGAVGIIAVQSQGYGEVNEKSLNAQDFCGPKKAAALSMSKKDAKRLMKETGLSFGTCVKVRLDALSTITPNTWATNIIGVLPGERPEKIMVSAHYDSYFTGFQDDNTAIAMMICMARALVLAGYKPRHTLVFCAFAAEEWGVIDSRYDWSTGAYNQIFRIHPDWQGQVIGGINLELPAHAHGKKHKVRCAYELKPFIKAQLQALPPEMHRMYPKGVDVICPVQTWSDDFSLSLAGIPEMIDEFGSGNFMKTHYHSQYDTDEAYDPEIYQFHHLLYERLLLALDDTLLPPLDFSERAAALNQSLQNEGLAPEVEGKFRKAAAAMVDGGTRLAKAIRQYNSRYLRLVEAVPEAARELEKETAPLCQQILHVFRLCEDELVRLNWNEQAQFPHERAQENISFLHTARWQLAVGEGEAALEALREIDDNRYHAFGRAVSDYFADRALHQPPERLMWGAGRLGERLDLYPLLKQTEEKMARGDTAFGDVMKALRALQEEQTLSLTHAVCQETEALQALNREITALLSALTGKE